MNTVTTEDMSRSSKSPPTSFSSLPYDVTLNILARVSIIHRPTLSLVSKNFQSLFASRELHATRTLIEKNEKFTYICIKFSRNIIHKPRWWFIHAPTPTQQKLVPMPCFPYDQYPENPAVISIGSYIYVIGGFLNGKRSQSVFLLDCRTRQWRTIPELRVPRGQSAAGLIDGKIYVLGGCGKGENWGEIFDPKTQTWELLPPTTLTPHVLIEKDRELAGFWFYANLCFVVEENIFCAGSMLERLYWCDFENGQWLVVKGLEGLRDSLDFISVANLSGGRRLTVWWKKEVGGKTHMWCAEILLERRSREELYGTIEWSKILYTFKNSGYVSLLHSATVTC